VSVPSAGVSHDAELAGARPGEASSSNGTLRVQTVFHDVTADQADRLAAELVSRAHELANLPEYECDVDVNVEVRPELQLAPPEDSGAGSDRAR
jgi:hypothetical protein